jgi:hypothetical protein
MRSLSHDLWQLRLTRGIMQQHMVADCPLEDTVQHDVVLHHRPRRQTGRSSLRHPRLHGRRQDRPHRHFTEEGQEVLVEIAAIGRLGADLQVS